MSNIQLFSNNAKTTLAAQLLVGGTTMTVAASAGALFRTVASPNHELITLQRESDGAIEIIKVTTHTAANDVFAVIARAQEGTSALQFEIADKVQSRWTRGSAEAITQGVPFTGTPGAGSIDMQSARSVPATVGVTGINSVAVGNELTISSNNSVAIGKNIQVTAQGVGIGNVCSVTASEGIAIGDNATAGGVGGIAIGFSGVQANGNQSIAIGGANLVASNYRAIAIGWDFNNAANYSIAIGAGKFNTGAATVAIGNYGFAEYAGGVAIGSYAYTNFNATAIGEYTNAAFNGVAVGRNASTTSTGGIAIGRTASSTGTVSIAIGQNASVTNARGTVVGYSSSHSGYYGIAIGASITGLGDYSVVIGAAGASRFKTVAIGPNTVIALGADYAVAIGANADAGGVGGISIGYNADAGNDYGIAIGMNAQGIGGVAGGIVIGYNAYVEDSPYAIGIGSGVYMTGVNRAMGLGLNARPGAFDVAHIAHPIVNIADHAGVTFGDARARIRQFAGVEVVLVSKDYDLTDATPFDGGTLGTKDFWVMPGGVLFYPDEVGIITKAQTAVTTGPTASFGHGGAGTEILSNQLFASGVLGQVGGRGQYASAAPEGVGTVSIAMNGAATATALSGRFFVRGMMVES